MADMQNVLSTGQDQLLQSRLDRKQFVNLVDMVVQRAQANDNAITTEMRNAITAINQKLALIDRKAEIFDKPETEALEVAFLQFLNTAGVTSLLGAMSVNLNGNNYSVASVIETLVNADKIVVREILALDADELPTSVKYVLHDGFEVIMTYVRVDDEATGKVIVTGATTDWRGLAATDVIEFDKLSTERMIFGSPYVDVRYNLTKTTNIMFDLTTLLAEAAVIDSTVPDLDGDGIIGTPVA